MRRIDHLLPLLCISEPAAAYRVSRGSSLARSDASEGAAADTEPDPGRSTQMLLASREDGDTSFVMLHQEQEQGRLPTREDSVKCSAMPRNIRLQTPRHPSQPDMRVNGFNRGPPKFVHKPMPARLMRRARSSHNYHGKCMGAIDAVNEWRLPKVSEEEDEAVDQKDWQDDTLSSRVSSARGWNFESDSAYEGSNHDGSSFGHSEVEDCAAAVQRMERRLRGSAMKSEENIVHDKLVALEYAQITKLIHKLNQKEAHLAHWKNIIAQAWNETINTEKKLEKKRAEAAEKIQIKLRNRKDGWPLLKLKPLLR